MVMPLICSRSRLVTRVRRTMRAEVLADGADVGRDRHPVVVEHDDDVAVGVPGVVHPLVGEPAGERAVADDGDDLVVLALEVARGGHAERGRHRGRRRGRRRTGRARSRPTLEEAGEPAFLPQRREAVVPAGEQLPGVALVADVPDDLVARGVEHVEQRDRQLDDAEARADVPAGLRDDVDQAARISVGQRRELLAAGAASGSPGAWMESSRVMAVNWARVTI